MTGTREPIPAGTVSGIRGRWQVPGLTWIVRLLLVLGVLSAVLPGDAGVLVADVTVGLVIAVPLLRVGWLVLRWWQERDWRFVLLGVVLLAVVAGGGVLAVLGVGG